MALNDVEEREALARIEFRQKHPQEADKEIWSNSQVTDVFTFEYFAWGVAAAVIRKSDQKKGWLYWADDLPSRVYFGFRERE